MTLVGSEKRQIRKCFMLISMEISLLYRRLLPGLAWRAAAASSVVTLPGLRAARVARAPGTNVSISRACIRSLALSWFPQPHPLHPAVLGFLSHDGFIGPSPPDPFKLFLLPGISKEICGSPSWDAAIKSSACPAPPRSFATLFFCKRWGMAGSV